MIILIQSKKWKLEVAQQFLSVSPFPIVKFLKYAYVSIHLELGIAKHIQKFALIMTQKSLIKPSTALYPRSKIHRAWHMLIFKGHTWWHFKK